MLEESEQKGGSAMKSRIIAVAISFILFVFATSADVYANTNEVQVPGGYQIHQQLTDMLPDFIDFYGYDLVADLNRAGFTLAEFAWQLHRYLGFLYDAGILNQQDFDTYRENWLFYFVDGIVMVMSESDASAWGNVSLKGLVLNNIYVDALGLSFLGGFFSHDYVTYLVQNLEIAAYFDFLMRESSLEVVIPFGAAARAFLEYGETDELAAIIGLENVGGMGQMTDADVRINFLAGLLMDRIAPILSDVIDYYADFIIIPSPGMMVTVEMFNDSEEQIRELWFFADTAFLVTAQAGEAGLDIALSNTGGADFFMVLQTYDAYGNWHIFASDLVPAGELHTHLFPPHPDLDDSFKITVFGVDEEAISGDLIIKIQ